MGSDRLLEVSANFILFLSSLLLLIDIAPRDFLPSHKRRVQAVQALREKHNILGPLPSNVNVAPENLGMTIVRDPASYAVLADFIRYRSPLTTNVDWSRAVGIGYAVQSLPVGAAKLEAFRPLYVVQMPTGEETRFRLIPVGQLEDLEAWLFQQRQGSLTRVALILLVIGFFFQLVLSFWSTKG
jgi:hypothetical protein